MNPEEVIKEIEAGVVENNPPKRSFRETDRDIIVSLQGQILEISKIKLHLQDDGDKMIKILEGLCDVYIKMKGKTNNNLDELDITPQKLLIESTKSNGTEY